MTMVLKIEAWASIRCVMDSRIGGIHFRFFIPVLGVFPAPAQLHDSKQRAQPRELSADPLMRGGCLMQIEIARGVVGHRYIGVLFLLASQKVDRLAIAQQANPTSQRIYFAEAWRASARPSWKSASFIGFSSPSKLTAHLTASAPNNPQSSSMTSGRR
jgi:hypothetical protein